MPSTYLLKSILAVFLADNEHCCSCLNNLDRKCGAPPPCPISLRISAIIVSAMTNLNGGYWIFTGYWKQNKLGECQLLPPSGYFFASDLNDRSHTNPISSLKNSFQRSCSHCALSWPSAQPTVKLDYILVGKKSGLKVGKAE